MKRKILLADDHVIIRRGLKVLIDNYFGESEWIETDNTKNIIELIKNNSFTHLVLDMQLQDANIIDILAQVKEINLKTPILIYTMSSEDIFGPRMHNFGISAFVSKQSSEEEVIKAFNQFLDNKVYFSEHLQDVLNNQNNNSKNHKNPLDSLSEREFAVLGYLLQGDSIKDISDKLDLKPTTIATYKGRIFDKLSVNNLIDLRNIADLYNYKSN
ncbi:MAG: LuxR C-terminal-related transcriptional regulator [Bacteroidia bacterium]